MTDRSPRPEAPFRLNAGQQRKRAKELCRALRAGDPDALARFRTHHPAAARGDDAAGHARLADAQLVIARELGSPSWPRLMEHTTALARARAAIDGGAPPPDGDRRTLHIRCGSDIRATLREAGFAGDFLEYSNPYCQGPVTFSPDLPAIRARFIAGAYGGSLGLSEADVAAKLVAEDEGLARAAERYERVVLWFEHDSYDQLILARCLAHFAEAGAPPVLELAGVDHFPGAARFIGLGQLPPEALRMLWRQRRPLAAAALAAGGRVWDALRSDDPSALATLAGSDLDGLPDLPRALGRHLRELPWTGDGLSLTERLVLQIIEADGLPFGQVFTRLMREREPLPWLGDAMLLAIVEAMAGAGEPALAIRPGGDHWFQSRLDITAAGRRVLGGELDWLSLAPPERWVGGVRIAPGQPVWRWDEAAMAPRRCGFR